MEKEKPGPKNDSLVEFPNTTLNGRNVVLALPIPAALFQTRDNWSLIAANKFFEHEFLQLGTEEAQFIKAIESSLKSAQKEFAFGKWIIHTSVFESFVVLCTLTPNNRNTDQEGPYIKIITDSSGNIELKNSKWQEYTGRENCSTLQNLSESFHDDDLLVFSSKFEEFWKTLQPSEFNVRLRGKDSKYRWFKTYLHTVSVLTESRSSVRFVDIQNELDLAEHQQLTKQLQHQHTRLHQLAGSNVIGVMLCRVESGLILEANDYILQLFKYPKEALINKKSWKDLTPVGEYEDIDRIAFTELLHSGKTAPFEKDYLNAVGQRVPVLLSGALLSATEVICFVIDLSAQKSADTLKKNFMANISHEIRTPINGIMGALDIITETDLTPRQKDLIEMMSKSSQTMLDLINEILDFSKIGAGKMKFECEWFPLDELIEDVVEFFAEDANKKHIELIYNIHPPFLKFHSDKSRIRQVLVNLVGNSMKFTESGSVTINVQLAVHHNTPTLSIKVEDTGVGIPQDKLETLFKPFSQIDNSLSKKNTGTGLGLAISKLIVDELGGKIGVESSTRGSVFWFSFENCKAEVETLKVMKITQLEGGQTSSQIQKWFPGNVTLCPPAKIPSEPTSICVPAELVNPALIEKLAPHRVVILGEPPAQYNLPSTWEFIPHPLRKSKLAKILRKHPQHLLENSKSNPTSTLPCVPLLVVEDNLINQKIVIQMLKQIGQTNVQVADNGKEALELWKKSNFEVVLMDCHMPIMDGITCTKEIRKLELESRRNPIPIIALTANVLLQTPAMCKEAGFSDFVCKPIRKHELFSLLEKWIQPLVAVTGSAEENPAKKQKL